MFNMEGVRFRKTDVALKVPDKIKLIGQRLLHTESIGASQMKPFIPKMAYIPGGTFLMGHVSYRDECPARKVKISAFKLGLYKVTNEEFRTFLEATGQDIPQLVANEELSRHPVVNVSWENANTYCAWLSDIKGKNVRLPTEAEWEYAARGPVMFSKCPWGYKEDRLHTILHYRGTVPVDVHPEGNSWCGIYNMLGKVWEWTADWYACYDPDDLIDPKGPTSPERHGGNKVLRGGPAEDYDFSVEIVRRRVRGSWYPTGCDNNISFRIAEDCKNGD